LGNSVLKTARRIGKVAGINLVDETSELMVISQFGKIMHIDTKSIRAAGRSTQGVKLLDLEPQDKVAAAVVIPQKKPKPSPQDELSCNIAVWPMLVFGNSHSRA
jgi:DNA gyrase subunit A